MGMYDSLSFEIVCPFCRPRQPGRTELPVKYLERCLFWYGLGDVLPEMTPEALDEFRHEPAITIERASLYAIVPCPRERHHLAVCVEIRQRTVTSVRLLEDQDEARRFHRRSREIQRQQTRLFEALLQRQQSSGEAVPR